MEQIRATIKRDMGKCIPQSAMYAALYAAHSRWAQLRKADRGRWYWEA